MVGTKLGNGRTHQEMRELVKSDLLLLETWLPHQGPLEVFVHRNTLSAFEDQLFWDAVESSSEIRHAQPYMPHSWYLSAVQSGRIELRHCEEPLSDFAASHPEVGHSAFSAIAVRRAALLVPRMMTSDEAVESATAAEFRSSNRDTDDSRALWVKAAAAIQCLTRAPDRSMATHAKQTHGLTKVDGILIQLASAFMDGGVALWPMPQRQSGFFAAVRSMLLHTESAAPGPWSWFGAEARKILQNHHDPVAVIAEIVGRQTDADFDCLSTLRNEALALPGWAGAFATLGHSNQGCQIKADLAEFLAVRLLLKISLSNIEERSEVKTPAANEMGDKCLWLVWELHRVLRVMGVTAAATDSWTVPDWQRLQDILMEFGDFPRRRCLQFAYERKYLNQVLGAIKSKATTHEAPPPGSDSGGAIELQAVFCIDEREESLRRNLEELAPEIETFGAAGFFGIDMLFRNAAGAPATPLCPPVIQPKHLVIERDLQPKSQSFRKFSGFVHESSRRFFGGALLAQAGGIAAVLPLASRVLLPGFGAKHIHKTSQTVLEFEHQGGFAADGVQIGYSVTEMADRVEGILRGIGLIENFSAMVVMIGHGSQSLNNPHESAHDCGACGGRRGAPNARVFARMANHVLVRDELSVRGLTIPKETWFVGAYHDTCSDELSFFDTHTIPFSHQAIFDQHRQSFDRARALNAAERCRRFSRGNLKGAKSALKHVTSRSSDLRQPRPEYGHATNAALIVGKRALTRNLFLDRRAFLLSYDPDHDGDGQILGRLLGAVIPVCAGINLEYYFSFVDNEKYGCGTKLPHNIVGLMGVMNGAQSDLRTGLPLQMVEIHEPMRLAVVVQSTEDIVSQLMATQPSLSRLVDNEWIQMHIFDPSTGVILRRANRSWKEFAVDSAPLPRIRKSVEYTTGRSGFLAPVTIAGEY